MSTVKQVKPSSRALLIGILIVTIPMWLYITYILFVSLRFIEVITTAPGLITDIEWTGEIYVTLFSIFIAFPVVWIIYLIKYLKSKQNLK